MALALLIVSLIARELSHLTLKGFSKLFPQIEVVLTLLILCRLYCASSQLDAQRVDLITAHGDFHILPQRLGNALSLLALHLPREGNPHHFIRSRVGHPRGVRRQLPADGAPLEGVRLAHVVLQDHRHMVEAAVQRIPPGDAGHQRRQVESRRILREQQQVAALHLVRYLVVRAAHVELPQILLEGSLDGDHARPCRHAHAGTHGSQAKHLSLSLSLPPLSS
mmetsp:Transcript_10094/g.38229  ORF Transcript_10094/g.38229 Transcript_10094/m.38229 type:complete len:222 (+) Transcript_10094:278-943(+)